ncbi:MAG: hypothetical protein ACO20U_01870 [Candidatus Planktophila sp.]
MKAQKTLIAFLSTLALAASLSACGGEDTTASTDDQTLVETVEEKPQASGGFDTPVVTPDNVSYTLTSPASFTPGKFASGMLPGYKNERFDVTVVNNSGKELDLATLIVKGSTTSGECVDIFDGDNQMEGAPITPLANGATAKFSWGLSCNGKSGDELSVVLTNGTSALIEVTGKVA